MRTFLWLVPLLIWVHPVLGQGTNNTAKPAGIPPLTQQKAPKNAPSLADTEKWILNTFTDHSGEVTCSEYYSSISGSTYGAEFDCFIQHYSLEFDGCKATLFTFHSHSGLIMDRATGQMASHDGKDPSQDYKVELNLGDIDPESIMAKDPRGTFGPIGKKTYHENVPQVDLCISTTDNANTMLQSSRFKLHELCNFPQFVTVEPDYAPRLLNALKHAVELCGGKPSAF